MHSFFQKVFFFKIKIEVRNCIILDKYNNDGEALKLIDCTKVNYDTYYLTLYPHYTYDAFCVGPKMEQTLSEKGCDAGNCIDTECGKTIGFPEGVIPYTTININSKTPSFTATPKFSKSSIFSESSKFSKSLEFEPSKKFSASSVFSLSNTLISLSSDEKQETSSIDEVSTEIAVSLSKKFTNSDIFSPSETNLSYIERGNQGKSNKGSKKAMIGAISGVIAAVVVVAVVVAILFIRKRKMMNLTSGINMMETDDSGVTTQNALRNVMQEDDPFADEFANDNPANGGLVI